jgi:bifunctional non-homologous end joining protein LigD
LPAVRARCSPYASVGQLRLLSRNGNDMTANYPELGVLAERVNVPVSLDGEIIAIRGRRPNFGLLQSRMHVRRPCGRLLSDAPVQPHLFDLLQVGGEPLLGLPYTARRAAARPAR